MDLLREKQRALGQHLQVAAAVIGSAVVGAAVSSDASRSAANTQADAARQATDSQQDMFNRTVQLEQPYNDAGLAATSRLGNLLGTSGDSSDPEHGSLLRPFSASDFQLDPGIQFQQRYGQQALQSSQAAQNGVMSGAALKDLLTFNQGLAGTGYQSAFDRYMANRASTYNSLMGMAQMGQAAAGNTVSATPGFSSGIASTITGAGNATAAGTVGSANAISSGLTGAGNAYLLSNYLRGGSSGAGGSASPGAAYSIEPALAADTYA